MSQLLSVVFFPQEFARLNTLKATSASGMVVYRLSDVKTHDELGNALYGCKAMRAPTDAFHEDHSGVDHHDDGHVDYASPNMPLISEVAAATAIPGALDAFGRINTQTTALSVPMDNPPPQTLVASPCSSVGQTATLLLPAMVKSSILIWWSILALL